MWVSDITVGSCRPVWVSGCGMILFSPPRPQRLYFLVFPWLCVSSEYETNFGKSPKTKAWHSACSQSIPVAHSVLVPVWRVGACEGGRAPRSRQLELLCLCDSQLARRAIQPHSRLRAKTRQAVMILSSRSLCLDLT